MKFEDWIEEYKPIMDGDSLKDFDTIEDNHLLKDANEVGRLWTIIETDGTMTISNGYHHVNKFALVITDKAYTGEDVLEVDYWTEQDEKDLIMHELNGLKVEFTYKNMKRKSLTELRELQSKHM